MNKIKAGVIFIFLMFFSISLASAYGYSNYIGSSQNILNNLISAGSPLIEAVLGPVTDVGEFSPGEMLFMKFLIFLLLFIIIQAVLKKIPLFSDNNAVITILSVAIPIIGIRFMSANEMIYGILLPYGTLAAALMIILPYVIFFFFIHNSGLRASGRRLAWIVFLIIFLALWLSRYDSQSIVINQIYIWSTLVLILTATFDKKINAYLRLGSIKKWYKDLDEERGLNLKLKYQKYLPLAGDPVADKILTKIKKDAIKLGIDLSTV